MGYHGAKHRVSLRTGLYEIASHVGMLRKAMQRGKADVADTRPLFSTLSYCLNSVSHTAGGYGDGCAGFYRFCAAALETGKIGKKTEMAESSKSSKLEYVASSFFVRFFA